MKSNKNGKTVLVVECRHTSAKDWSLCSSGQTKISNYFSMNINTEHFVFVLNIFYNVANNHLSWGTISFIHCPCQV